jgi:hypothetical protein
MKRESILATMLILSLSVAPLATAETQTKTEYELALSGPTWDRSTIQILITHPSNESWWTPVYLNATLHAINQWNQAIAYFAANYASFAYLAQLTLAPQISNSLTHSNSSADSNFDAYISWTQQFDSNVSCEAGLSRTTYDLSGLITNNTLTIAVYDCVGNVLDEADSQNVALHEMGHMLGLGHGNYSADLMYYAYSLGSSVRAISTLDLYGVATVFRWMATAPEFNRTNQGSPIYSVTLPPDIPYEKLPISEENLPPQSPLDNIITYIGSLPELIAAPELWGIMALFTVAVVCIYLVGKHARRKHTVPKTT